MAVALHAFARLGQLALSAAVPAVDTTLPPPPSITVFTGQVAVEVATAPDPPVIAPGVPVTIWVFVGPAGPAGPASPFGPAGP